MFYTNAVDIQDGEVITGMTVQEYLSKVNVLMVENPTELGYLEVKLAYLLRDMEGDIVYTGNKTPFNVIPIKNLIIKFQNEDHMVNDEFNLMGTLRDDFLTRYPELDIANTWLQPVSVARQGDTLIYAFEIYLTDAEEVKGFISRVKGSRIVSQFKLQSILSTLKYKVREE
nr:MAG TPA: hypothetical protein [Caudoviricetes sp.]